MAELLDQASLDLTFEDDHLDVTVVGKGGVIVDVIPVDMSLQGHEGPTKDGRWSFKQAALWGFVASAKWDDLLEAVAGGPPY